MTMDPLPRSLVCVVTLIVAMSTEVARGQQENAAITADGERLNRYFDSLDVEHHWLPGHSIHWRTGRDFPDGPRAATHCSSFVAAACDGLGVYILRPPQHSQILLANAQHEWLEQKGAENGWQKVRSEFEAQRLANQGWIVVVSHANPNKHRPGHIALVRPSNKSTDAIKAEGPDIIQAGRVNYSRTPMSTGFRSPDTAVQDHRVAFFAHLVASSND
ncbi:MAG: hypothetical protein U1D30_20790 [Planctomycetota bacterium]